MIIRMEQLQLIICFIIMVSIYLSFSFSIFSFFISFALLGF